MKLTEAQKAALISFAERFPDAIYAVLSRDPELIEEQFDANQYDDEDDKGVVADTIWEADKVCRLLRPRPVLKAAE